MQIPSFKAFIHPLLQFLDEHRDGVRIVDAYEAVAERMGVSADDKVTLLPSGIQPVYQNRIGWAHDRLKRAGLSASPRRGVWQLTEAGRTFAATHPDGFSEEEHYRLSNPRQTSLKAGRGEETMPATVVMPPPPATDSASPVERIDSAVAEIEESVSAELLDLIGRSPPTFFENLVLDLLHKMGYGTSRADLQRVGGTGDGGIDGIISLDRLGLEKVYVQAKRWQGTVGRPALQGFFGALKGRRANKGVFITTSSFTRDAVEFAEQVSDSIVLVDGDRLSALMIEHGVGVNHRAIRIAQVDGDYFDEV